MSHRNHGPVGGVVELVADKVLNGMIVVVAGMPYPLVGLEDRDGVGSSPVHGLAAEPKELHVAVEWLGVGRLCQALVPFGTLHAGYGLHVQVWVRAQGSFNDRVLWNQVRTSCMGIWELEAWSNQGPPTSNNCMVR